MAEKQKNSIYDKLNAKEAPETFDTMDSQRAPLPADLPAYQRPTKSGLADHLAFQDTAESLQTPPRQLLYPDTAKSLQTPPPVEPPKGAPKLPDLLGEPKKQQSFQKQIAKDIKETGGKKAPLPAIPTTPDLPEAGAEKPEDPMARLNDLENKLIDKKYEIMSAYKDLRSKKEWAQVAEMFAKALTSYAAAREGMRKGVDLSNIKTEGVNWDAQAKNDLAELDTLLGDLRSEQAMVSKEKETLSTRAFREAEGEKERGFRREQASQEETLRRDLAADRDRLERDLAQIRGGIAKAKAEDKPLTPAQRLSTLKQLQQFNESKFLQTEKQVNPMLEQIQKNASSFREGDIPTTRANIKAVTSSLLNHLPGDKEAAQLKAEIDQAAEQQIGVTGRDDYSKILSGIQDLQEKARERALSLEAAQSELSQMERSIGAAPSQPVSTAPEEKVVGGVTYVKVPGGWKKK